MPCLNHPATEERLARCARCGQTFCGDCVVRLSGALRCAPCKEQHVRDIQSGVEESRLDLASIGYRFVALLIDNVALQSVMCLLFVPLFMVVGVAAGASQGSENMVGILVQLATLPFSVGLPILYEGLMLKSRGQTLGKMALSIRVVTPEGHPITAREAWLRAISKGVLNSCCLGLVDQLVGVFTWERTALHDLMAKTRVVKVQR